VREVAGMIAELVAFIHKLPPIMQILTALHWIHLTIVR
jgi:hypothetical protein